MSTNASQTLFRFTSLRNPELTTTKENFGFITRPKIISGGNIGEEYYFDKLLKEKVDQNQTKLAYLMSRAKEFKNDSKYISNLEDLSKIVDLEYFDSININDDEYKYLGIKDLLNEGVLWDNLVYQSLTEENFYLKEKIVEVFKKQNYTNLDLNSEIEGIIKPNFNDEESENLKKQAREAKVVLPAELFVESEETKKRLAKSNSSVLSATALQELQQKAEKKLIVEEAKLEKEKLEVLKNELANAQTIYQKNYEKALKLKQDEYQESIRVEREDYELRLLQAEANLASDATEAQRKLALANVTKPDYDTFNFIFRKELDTTFLESKLSSETLDTLGGIVGLTEDPVVAEEGTNGVEQDSPLSVTFNPDEYESFADVIKSVEDKITIQTQLIIANTEVEKEQFVNIGGVMLPVSDKQNNETYTLIIGKRSINRSNIEYNFNVDINIPIGWEIKNSKFYYKDSNGDHVLTILPSSQTESTISYISLLGNYISLASFNSISEVKFEVVFSNGAKGEFIVFLDENGSRINTRIPKTGILSIDYNNEENPINNQGNNPENNFIPSGFGVRRLGIADYLKVEQSTHAYVPGEVAHIENIMAREYREKSTRRLSRSENTTTSSSETEREQLTDTTTATRYEMQTEIAKMMSETTDISTSVNAHYGGSWGIEMGASFANNRSKEESSRAATTQAQDITARALDRIVSKVKEERISKVIEEFEENNMHGFDNRQGDQHVVGVYRWVDKIMKNQIFDYGKRMMFEFMIPQPSKIHRLAMTNMSPTKVIDKPIDPRKFEKNNLSDYSKITTETLKFWGSYYNVELPNFSEEIYVGKAFSFTTGETDKKEYDEVFAKDDFIEIPEGYETTKAKASIYYPTRDKNNGIYVSVGNRVFSPDLKTVPDNNRPFSTNDTQNYQLIVSPFINKIPVSISQMGLHAGNVNVEVKCQLTDYGRRLLFNKIIDAYEEALAAYEEKVKSSEETAITIKETNANFYRQIESDVLKHNCMAYLVDPTKLGTQLYDGTGLFDFSVKQTQGMDEYAALTKFMEQAFEWDIMSYNFYPYFWGARKDWGELYQSESIDPLFRSFLQSGMARVVVTVKPGFEDAVQFYMSTGKIWNGGEVPVIGDPLYLSIVDEIRQPVGEKVGKFWMTKIPTSLNILQAQSIGLEVVDALPHTIENKLDCENPDLIVDKLPFNNQNSLLNGGSGTGNNSVEVENVVSGDWSDSTSVD